MRAAAFSTVLMIDIGFAITFSTAIPRAAFAGQAPEFQTDVSRADQAQFQKFAQWRDRHGVSGETCLAQPEGAAAPGTRWHYHIDAVTQRQCWYQKPVGAAPAVAAGKNSHVTAAKTSRAQAPDSGRSKRRPRPAERASALPVAPVERASALPAASTLPLTPPERETLFRQFQQWREDRAAQ
jgi:hypothetical protein